MLKFCLCAVLLFACGAAGWLKGQESANRVNHIRDLLAGLKALESEMRFRRDPLPVLLRRGGLFARGKACELFLLTGERICRGAREFETCWQRTVEDVYAETALTAEDREILKGLAAELGKTDLENQGGLFQRTLFLLEKQEKAAEEEKRTKSRMWQALGLAMGALLVIALV